MIFAEGFTGLVSFDHLMSLSGRRGLFEHAKLSQPRFDHGYSLDDNGRALVVVARAAASGVYFPNVARNRCLNFVLRARQADGWKDRQSTDGLWNQTASEDAVGRALWGLGSAAGWWPDAEGRLQAEAASMESLEFDSKYWRSRAYALLGLTVLNNVRSSPPLVAAIARLANSLPRPRRRQDKWMWPDGRLRYDNARLPEALIVGGKALDDPRMTEDGIRLLEWLVEMEIGDRGFSFTPVAGRSVGGRQPEFDQQPLEAWAMADACARASEVTGDRGWLVPAGVAISWFLGENDQRIAVYDPESGACCDGLTSSGVNLNQGAESTLSALGALLALRRPPAAP